MEYYRRQRVGCIVYGLTKEAGEEGGGSHFCAVAYRRVIDYWRLGFCGRASAGA